ncbi:MAG: PLP-dependent aminotransferase family protein [Planctomycetota bacterium]
MPSHPVSTTPNLAKPPELLSTLPLGLSRAARHAADQPISGLIKLALEDPGIISLAAGLVDYDTLPGDEVAPLLQSLLEDDSAARAALQYGTTEGYAGFREALYRHLAGLEGCTAEQMPGSAEDVVVTTGSQQLLHTLADVLLDEGDIVISGWPSYFVYTSALTQFGATIRAIDLDQDGMVPDKLERLLKGLHAAGQLTRVKMLYLVSYHQNPTGITLSPERRPQILDLVRRYSELAGQRIVLVEDAAYRELTYEGEPPPSIKSYDTSNQFVALCQTFSKPYAPGLKTGYGLLPTDLVEPVKLSKGGRDFGSSNFCHHLLHRALETGVYDRHVELLKQAYAVKLHATLEALEEHFGGMEGATWTKANGGMYVWLTLPEIDTTREGPLFTHAIEQGMLFVPGKFCYPTDPTRTPPTDTIRLAVGVPTVDQIREGIARLARAVEAVEARDH